ncbi:hypothetical protein LEYRA_30 [Paenibacillus phage Leyra]|uniref:Uncharacterized protein n=2 Tax=Fernvirus TaxID=2843380 RepID=A0A0K2CYZ4_9CAUD|nr:hypothetical protein XENIA_30 [Paenibacillus phage Xenia]YP_009836574.1 hypothetical protein HWB47_gp30 [Paenibacillus phage Leyra]ALA12561.1 hypothetical protein XENIA_30 [Paenibacillus phage Xenia]AUS03894.1 hypothetical protein LEYRA_30 [Paenibacillus phage Leyra]UYL93703.1 helix-turn-helix domain protein [Paenibacillus phage vB_PlaS-5/A]
MKRYTLQYAGSVKRSHIPYVNYVILLGSNVHRIINGSTGKKVLMRSLIKRCFP